MITTKKEIPAIRFSEKYQRFEMSCYDSKTKLRKFFSCRDVSAKKAKIILTMKYLEWIDEINGNERLQKTLAEVWDEFLDYNNHLKIKSFQTLKSYRKYFFDIEYKIFSKIPKYIWQEIIDESFFQKKIFKKSSLHKLINVIIRLNKFASSRGYIKDSDVPLFFEIPKGIQEGTEKKILQKKDLDFIFSDNEITLNFKYIYVIRFLILTGLRIGELINLEVNRDLKKNVLTINTNLKTKNAKRKIVLSDIAYEQILQHRRKFFIPENFTYLFSTNKNKKISHINIYNEWKNFSLKNNLNVSSLHELRHTFISFAYNKADVDLEILKNIVGHSKNMATEKTYVHHLEKSAEEILKEEIFLQEINEKISKSIIY